MLQIIFQIGTIDAIPGLLTVMRNQRSRHYKVRIIIVLLITLAFSSLCYSFDNIILFSDTVLERAIEAGLSIIKVRIENVWIKKEIYADIYYYDVKVLNVLFGNYSKKSDSLSAGASYGSALSVGKKYIIFASEGGWAFRDSVIEITNTHEIRLETKLADRAKMAYSKTKLALKNILGAYLSYVKSNNYAQFRDLYFDKHYPDQHQFQEIRKALLNPEIITTWKNGNFGYGLVVNRSGSSNSEALFFYFVYKNNRWNLVYDSIVYPYPENPKETDIPKVDWEYIAPFDPKTLKKIEAEKEYLKSPMVFLRYLVSRESYILIFTQHLSFLSGAENELVLRKYLTSVQPCAGVSFPYESNIMFETTIGAAAEKILKQFKRASSRRDATTEK